MRGRSIPLDRATSWAAHSLIRVALAMPYPKRVRFFGLATSKVIGPLTGHHRRIRRNLALVMPELTEADVRQLCRAVTDNIGRTLIENYSHREFSELCADLPLAGPGWEAHVAARKVGRPTVFFTGHYGNYAAARFALRARGYSLGVIYRPFNNKFIEAHHRAALEKIGPTFARGTAGTGEMVRHLKSGKSLAIMADQHFENGAPLRFFGLPAATSTAPARLALKYGAILVPVYGVRRQDGLSFDLVFERPIPANEPEVMTQALNDSLEAMIRKHPEQWMWSHRRWKLAGHYS